MRRIRAKTVVACACACAISATPIYAAFSTRPGWGSTPYGAGGTGVTFRVWAPNATNVTVKGQFNGNSNTANPLFSEGTNGVWSVDVTNAVVGHAYKYFINGTLNKQDPRGRSEVSSTGNTYIYNTTNFNWSGDTFVSTNVPLNDAVIYELNIGTFNDTGSGPGTFVTATNRLPYLKQLGITAVEVMPINEFPGDYSWGYNPSDMFGVESAFGGPDGFKKFVKACHSFGIAVLVDVVHNHYGQPIWTCGGLMDRTRAHTAGSISTNSPASAARGGEIPDPTTPVSRSATSSKILSGCGWMSITWTVSDGIRPTSC